MERKFDNAKDFLCVVTYMEDTMKIYGDKNIQEFLDEEESKSIMRKKRLELVLTRYRDREEKVK